MQPECAKFFLWVACCSCTGRRSSFLPGMLNATESCFLRGRLGGGQDTRDCCHRPRDNNLCCATALFGHWESLEKQRIEYSQNIFLHNCRFHCALTYKYRLCKDKDKLSCSVYTASIRKIQSLFVFLWQQRILANEVLCGPAKVLDSILSWPRQSGCQQTVLRRLQLPVL